MKIKFKKYWRKTSLKNKEDAYFLLEHIKKKKPKNLLEIGIFHGVTSRNICELLNVIHEGSFKFTGIDIFSEEKKDLSNEIAPKTQFSNPLKNFYYKHIARLDPYTYLSVNKLLSKFSKNINIIKGNSNKVLQEIKPLSFDYVFLDGGHKYETVKSDLENLTEVIKNNGTLICDDYNLSYAPGVKKAIDEYVGVNNFNLEIHNKRFAEITKK
jgi:predicted O-methyltransferase YrrM